MTSVRPLGVMPDFNKIHQIESKRAALSKSTSSKSLTEFVEFRLSNSTPRGGGQNSNNKKALTDKTDGSNTKRGHKENDITKTNKTVKEGTNGSKKAELSTPRFQAPTASQMSRQSVTGVTTKSSSSASTSASSSASSMTQSKRTNVPSSSVTSPKTIGSGVVNRSIRPSTATTTTRTAGTTTKISSPSNHVVRPTSAKKVQPSTIESMKVIPISVVEPIPTVPLVEDDDDGTNTDDSLGFCDDDFAIDSNSMNTILKADTWQEDETDEVPPLPMSMMNGIHNNNNNNNGLHSILEPNTPRRSTLTGMTAQNLLTPRAANRGSIYGGALRTPQRAPKSDLIRTPASRLTISSGVLPSSLASASTLKQGSTLTPAAAAAASTAIQQARQRMMQSQHAIAMLGSSLKDLASEHQLPTSLFPSSSPSSSLSLSSSTPARTPLKHHAATRSLHANFMSPTQASKQQQANNTPNRTYVNV